jgi:hypothetical protein
METSQSNPHALDLADGPPLGDTELGVHIIHVPEARGYSGQAGLSEITSQIGKPDPTDIVVYEGKPWHCAGRAGHRKEPRAHPKVHEDYPETVLVIAKGESVVWWSETDFRITKIEPSVHEHQHACFREATTDAPRYPFAASPSLLPETRTAIVDNRQLYVARSGVRIPEAEGHMYKIEFMMEGDRIDPDMYCGGSN